MLLEFMMLLGLKPGHACDLITCGLGVHSLTGWHHISCCNTEGTLKAKKKKTAGKKAGEKVKKMVATADSGGGGDGDGGEGGGGAVQMRAKGKVRRSSMKKERRSSATHTEDYTTFETEDGDTIAFLSSIEAVETKIKAGNGIPNFEDFMDMMAGM
jgi:hypothetical protein